MAIFSSKNILVFLVFISLKNIWNFTHLRKTKVAFNAFLSCLETWCRLSESRNATVFFIRDTNPHSDIIFTGLFNGFLSFIINKKRSWPVFSCNLTVMRFCFSKRDYIIPTTLVGGLERDRINERIDAMPFF